jgi:hypothetical protein
MNAWTNRRKNPTSPRRALHDIINCEEPGLVYLEDTDFLAFKEESSFLLSLPTGGLSRLRLYSVDENGFAALQCC